MKADVRSGARQRALELSKCIVTCDDLMARRTFPQEWPVKDNAEVGFPKKELMKKICGGLAGSSHLSHSFPRSRLKAPERAP